MRRLAVLHSTIRVEEKLIRRAALDRGLDVRMIDVREEILHERAFRVDFDVALERSVSSVKGKYAAAFLEFRGVRVVNPTRVGRLCEDKYLTSLLLARENIPTARFAMAFHLPQALDAVGMLGGFPVVVKPPLGSWGRLLAKVNDLDSLESVFEHKNVLGTPPHKALYLQEYIRKPGRDIRVFTAGSEVLCAVARESSHWITNTARGARTRNRPVDGELRGLSLRTAAVFGEAVLAIDVFETDMGLMVNEINHNMEFRNSEEPTGVDIAGAIVDFCLRGESPALRSSRVSAGAAG